MNSVAIDPAKTGKLHVSRAALGSKSSPTTYLFHNTSNSEFLNITLLPFGLDNSWLGHVLCVVGCLAHLWPLSTKYLPTVTTPTAFSHCQMSQSGVGW